jgi:hypothetical protein
MIDTLHEHIHKLCMHLQSQKGPAITAHKKQKKVLMAFRLHSKVFFYSSDPSVRTFKNCTLFVPAGIFFNIFSIFSACDLN